MVPQLPYASQTTFSEIMQSIALHRGTKFPVALSDAARHIGVNSSGKGIERYVDCCLVSFQ